MRFAFLIIFSLFVFFISYPSQAQQEGASGALISGAYLMKLCEVDGTGKELFKGAKTSCQSYIAGIIDYHKLLRSLGTAPSLDFCVPNTVKLNDVQIQIWNYLDANSQHDGFNAAPAVAMALFQHYPCRK